MKGPTAEVDVLVMRKDPTTITAAPDEDSHGVLLPRAMIVVEPEEYEAGDKVTITMPEWLAIDHGLV